MPRPSPTDPRWDISALVHAYAERIDAGDFDGVADLFADAVVTAEGSDVRHEGRDAVRAMYEHTTRRHDDGTPRTLHVTTNLIVELDDGGTEASARSVFTVLQAVPGELALQPIIAGRYRDRFALADGRWRFTHRHMQVELVGDLSHHLLIDLG